MPKTRLTDINHSAVNDEQLTIVCRVSGGGDGRLTRKQRAIVNVRFFGHFHPLTTRSAVCERAVSRELNVGAGSTDQLSRVIKVQALFTGRV